MVKYPNLYNNIVIGSLFSATYDSAKRESKNRLVLLILLYISLPALGNKKNAHICNVCPREHVCQTCTQNALPGTLVRCVRVTIMHD